MYLSPVSANAAAVAESTPPWFAAVTGAYVTDTGTFNPVVPAGTLKG